MGRRRNFLAIFKGFPILWSCCVAVAGIYSANCILGLCNNVTRFNCSSLDSAKQDFIWKKWRNVLLIALKISNSGFNWFMNTEYFSLAAMHLSPKFYNCGDDDEGSPAVFVAYLPTHILVWVGAHDEVWWTVNPNRLSYVKAIYQTHILDPKTSRSTVNPNHMSNPYIGPKNHPTKQSSGLGIRRLSCCEQILASFHWLASLARADYCNNPARLNLWLELLKMRSMIRSVMTMHYPALQLGSKYLRWKSMIWSPDHALLQLGFKYLSLWWGLLGAKFGLHSRIGIFSGGGLLQAYSREETFMRCIELEKSIRGVRSPQRGQPGFTAES